MRSGLGLLVQTAPTMAPATEAPTFEDMKNMAIMIG